jgi:hypothetical protein
LFSYEILDNLFFSLLFVTEMSIAAENLPLPRRDVSRKKLPRRCLTTMVSKKTLPRRCRDAIDYKIAAAAMVFKKIFRI